MTMEHYSRNFYDSDFDSRNESNFLNESVDLLNIAFIESPGKSIKTIYNDSSVNEFAEMDYDYEKEDHKKARNQQINKVVSGNQGREELSHQQNDMEAIDEVSRKKSPFEKNIGQYLVTNSKSLGVEKNWVSARKKKLMPRFDVEIGNTNFSEITTSKDLTKKNEEKLECILSSTCLDEIQTFEEYDHSIFEKQSWYEMKDKPEATDEKNCEYDKIRIRNLKLQTGPKVPVSRFDYEYHELSTIVEVDSLVMDESVESLMNPITHRSSITQNSKNPKFSKMNDSFETLFKSKAYSNFPANVAKVIQNRHFEELLKEPGILEETDLTLISMDFDSTCKISEKSADPNPCYSCYKIKSSNDEESPSMISFLQHELSCMKDCTNE